MKRKKDGQKEGRKEGRKERLDDSKINERRIDKTRLEKNQTYFMKNREYPQCYSHFMTLQTFLISSVQWAINADFPQPEEPRTISGGWPSVLDPSD